MNAREQALIFVLTDRLRGLGEELIVEGWRPELVVLDPTEIARIPGYKVALVVPTESAPESLVEP